MHRKSKVTDKGARLKWIGRVHVLPCRGVGSEEKVKWLKNNSKLRLYFSFFNVLYQGTNLLGTYKVSPHWVLWLRQKKIMIRVASPTSSDRSRGARDSETGETKRAKLRSGREFPVRLYRSLLYPVPLSKGRRETDITPLAFSTSSLTIIRCSFYRGKGWHP